MYIYMGQPERPKGGLRKPQDDPETPPKSPHEAEIIARLFAPSPMLALSVFSAQDDPNMVRDAALPPQRPPDGPRKPLFP